MDTILDAPIESERRLNYAGFWIRVAAFIIDYIVILAIIFVLAFAFDFSKGMNNTFSSAIFALIYFGMILLYFPGMESSSKQATIGKMAVGIKVGKANGETISFGNALGRYFAKILSGIILYIGFMMVGWDDHKQGLHDRLANTYVF